MWSVWRIRWTKISYYSLILCVIQTTGHLQEKHQVKIWNLSFGQKIQGVLCNWSNIGLLWKFYYISQTSNILGVFKLINGEFGDSLEVMPLSGGFLPLPAVKLYKYKSSAGKSYRDSLSLNLKEKDKINY